jgi:hypothetical protein
MTTKLDSDFRSYLQDMGTDANKLLGDILRGGVDEDDISDDAKESIIAIGKDFLDYINRARADIAAAEIDRQELRSIGHREWEAAE